MQEVEWGPSSLEALGRDLAGRDPAGWDPADAFQAEVEGKEPPPADARRGMQVMEREL